MTRRRFLKGAAAAGLGSVGMPLAGQAEGTIPELPTNALGRTKLQVSRIGLGGRSGRVLTAAVEAGVNLVHSSTQYGRGRALREMAGVFAKRPGMRDKLVLCLKGKAKELEGELDGMLKVLRTDRADVYLPMLPEANEELLDRLIKVQDALQKKGKIRFKGFVCHSSLNEVFEMILAKAPGYFDVGLLATRLIVAGEAQGGEESARYARNLAELKAQGLGVISMKSGSPRAMAEGAKVFQAHCKTLLAGGADTVLFTFGSLQQVHRLKELDLRTTVMTPWEQRLAETFHRASDDTCLMCGRCARSCPRGVPVNDLVRIRMYHDEYGDYEYALDSYRELRDRVGDRQQACGDCTVCADACPIGLARGEHVEYVTTLFA
ncbi:MAG: aldo/keto reductase [Phycisphaerae bacterium]|nr:aldo/keto reductase [Phycisphaerae bacterium]